MKTINDFNLKDKYVLLRSDLNSAVKNKKIIPSERIKAASTTIKLLQKKGAKIVILAHQGTVGRYDFISLQSHAKELNKYCKVLFIKDILGNKARTSISKMNPGNCILLENVRFETDEFKPKKRKNKFYSKEFLGIFDLYINDAFSVSHRNQTSITGFPKKIDSCAGPLIVEELKAIERMKTGKRLYILGGGKPQTNIKLLGKGDIIAGGYFANMVLISRGTNLGKISGFSKGFGMTKSTYNVLLSKLRQKGKNIIAPLDFAVDYHGKRKEFSLEEFPKNYLIKDIGSKTIKKYISIINKYDSVYMKGPMGYSEEKEFFKGTFEILKAISKARVYSIIGGGHLSDAVKDSKIPKKKFNHVSLSGGALLNYIAGEKLVGLEVLGYY